MLEEENGTYRVFIRNSITDGIGILLFFGGIVSMGFTPEPKLWQVIIASAVGIVLSVLMLFVFKFRKLIVIITDEGITERASKVSDGLIRWEEIKSVSIYDSEMSNNLDTRRGEPVETDKFIGIKLKDPDAYAEKLRGIKKMLFDFNKRAMSNHVEATPINIPCNILGDDDVKFVEICEAMLNKSRKR